MFKIVRWNWWSIALCRPASESGLLHISWHWNNYTELCQWITDGGQWPRCVRLQGSCPPIWYYGRLWQFTGRCSQERFVLLDSCKMLLELPMDFLNICLLWEEYIHVHAIFQIYKWCTHQDNTISECRFWRIRIYNNFKIYIFILWYQSITHIYILCFPDLAA